MIPKNWMAVAGGGLLGAVSRYAIILLAPFFWRRPFPLATFFINVFGSFLIGVVFAFTSRRPDLDPAWRLLFATGFLGAFTTFSTLELETFQLRESGLTLLALLYIVASIVVGYLALQAGLLLGRR